MLRKGDKWDFQSVGRRFESCRAYHKKQAGVTLKMLLPAFFMILSGFGPSRQAELNEVPPFFRRDSNPAGLTIKGNRGRRKFVSIPF